MYYACESNRDCPKNSYILREAETEECAIFICDVEHNHSNQKRKGLPEETKKKVEELINNNVTTDNKKDIKKS